MVKKQFFAILICYFLFACGGQPEIRYVDKITEVKVPVTMIPAIKPIKKPSLPVTRLSSNSSNAATVEAYYNSLHILNMYSKNLELQLKPFYDEYNKKERESKNELQ